MSDKISLKEMAKNSLADLNFDEKYKVYRDSKANTEKKDQKDINDIYVPSKLPVEIHIHGLSDIDFSNDHFFDLEEVDKKSKEEGIMCVPSIFLAQYNLDNFVSFMKKFNDLKLQGKLNNIPGISLEGPLLGSFGGTPQKGTWLPTVDEWNKLISCSDFGLKYIVLSPDALTTGSCLYTGEYKSHPSLEWILSNIFKSGIKVSIGHFHKKNAKESAMLVNFALEVAKNYYPFSSGKAVIVDHFFNDMPSNITYAWRTPESKSKRDEELNNMKIDEWSLDNIEDILGILPSTIIKSARKGDLTVCINFDGEHVDHNIAKKVVHLIGAENVCAMTDRLEVNHMGNIDLHKKKGSSLWYQNSGAVAAGTSTIHQQMNFLRTMGFDEKEVWKMCSEIPHMVVEAGHKINELVSQN